MFCPKCGTQLPDDVRFCQYCGTSFSQSDVKNASADSVPTVGAPNNYNNTNLNLTNTSTDSEGRINDTPNGSAKRKKTVFPIIIGIVALIVVAIVVAIVCSLCSTKATLIRAFRKSGEELVELFDDNENFSDFVDNFGVIATSKEKSMTLDVGYDEIRSKYKNSTNVSLKVDIDNNSASVTGDVSTNTTSSSSHNPTDISFKAYVDEKELAISLPNELDDNYSVPLDKIGKKLLDSEFGDLLKDQLSDEDVELMESLDINLFADSSWDAFRKYDKKTVKEFEDSLDVKKSDKKIPHGSKNATVYSVNFDYDSLLDLIESYYSFASKSVSGIDINENPISGSSYSNSLDTLSDQLDDIDIDIYIGVENGCVTVLYIEGSVEDDERSVTCILNGKDNIWEDIKIYANKEIVAEVNYKQEKKGFTLTAKADNEMFVIMCDDDDCEIAFCEADDYGVDEVFSLNYGAKNKGCQLNFEIRDEYGSSNKNVVEVSLSAVPKAKVEKITKSINIVDMTQDQLEEIAEELGGAFGY